MEEPSEGPWVVEEVVVMEEPSEGPWVVEEGRTI